MVSFTHLIGGHICKGRLTHHTMANLQKVKTSAWHWRTIASCVVFCGAQKHPDVWYRPLSIGLWWLSGTRYELLEKVERVDGVFIQSSEAIQSERVSAVSNTLSSLLIMTMIPPQAGPSRKFNRVKDERRRMQKNTCGCMS